MRVAMIGLRDLPAKYSGVETAVDEIGARLVANGHEVFAYCMITERESSTTHKGIVKIYTPTLKSKNFAMIVYSYISLWHALRRNYDVIHLHAIGQGALALVCRIFRQKVVLTSHGLDYNREKWGFLARTYLKLGDYLGVTFSDEVIAVSKSLRAHYLKTYGRQVRFIPNGAAKVTFTPLGELTHKFTILSRNYILFVGRLVECKRVDLLIKAFCSLRDNDTSLVIVGDGPVEHVKFLKTLITDEKVVLTGPLFGTDLAAVFSNASMFVLPSVLEGLPIALLEALSYDLPVVVSDINENLEVIEGLAEPNVSVTVADDLQSLANGISKMLKYLAEGRRPTGNADFVQSKYNWDAITSETARVYKSEGRRGQIDPSDGRTGAAEEASGSPGAVS